MSPQGRPGRLHGAGRPLGSVPTGVPLSSRLLARLRAAVALPEEDGEIPARLLAEHLVVREPKSTALAPKSPRSSRLGPKIGRICPKIPRICP